MSKELIRDYYQKFNNGKFDAMVELLTENVVHDLNHGPTEVGREKFRAFLANMDKHYSEQVRDFIVLATDSPDRFAAEFFIEGTYLKSQPGLPEAKGQSYRIRVGAFFTTESGRIQRITNYYNLKNWIELVSK